MLVRGTQSFSFLSASAVALFSRNRLCLFRVGWEFREDLRVLWWVGKDSWVCFMGEFLKEDRSSSLERVWLFSLIFCYTLLWKVPLNPKRGLLSLASFALFKFYKL